MQYTFFRVKDICMKLNVIYFIVCLLCVIKKNKFRNELFPLYVHLHLFAITY